MGDFNFPNIDWSTLSLNHSQGREQKESAKALLDFMQHNMLSQVIKHSTRGQNTLELFLTNNIRIIRNVQTEKTALSDHDIVKINLLYNMKSPPASPSPHFKDSSFRSIDLQKADFPKINSILSEIDWDNLFQICEQDPEGNEFVELLYLRGLGGGS